MTLESYHKEDEACVQSYSQGTLFGEVARLQDKGKKKKKRVVVFLLAPLLDFTLRPGYKISFSFQLIAPLDWL
jgi:hypothetical protein